MIIEMKKVQMYKVPLYNATDSALSKINSDTEMFTLLKPKPPTLTGFKFK